MSESAKDQPSILALDPKVLEANLVMMTFYLPILSLTEDTTTGHIYLDIYFYFQSTVIIYHTGRF